MYYVCNRINNQFTIYTIHIDNDTITVNDTVSIFKNKFSIGPNYTYDPEKGLFLDGLLTPVFNLTTNKLAHQLIYDKVYSLEGDKVLVAQYVSDQPLVCSNDQLIYYGHVTIHCLEKAVVDNNTILVGSGYYKHICDMLNIKTEGTFKI